MNVIEIRKDGSVPIHHFVRHIVQEAQCEWMAKITKYKHVSLLVDTSIRETITYDPQRSALVWHPAHAQALRASRGDDALFQLLDFNVSVAVAHRLNHITSEV